MDKAFIKIEDGHWQFTDNPEAILNAEIVMFVDELNENSSYQYGNLFLNKYLEFKPDYNAVVLSKYKEIFDLNANNYYGRLNQQLIEYSGYDIKVKKLDHELIGSIMSNWISYLMNRGSSLYDEAEKIMESISQYLLEECNGDLLLTKEKNELRNITFTYYRKSKSVPFQHLEPMVKVLNRHGLHAKFDIEFIPKKNYDGKIIGYDVTKFDMAITENEIAAKSQLDEIEKTISRRKKYWEKKPNKKVAKTKKERRLRSFDIQSMAAFLEGRIREELSHLSKLSYGIIYFYGWQSGTRNIQTYAARVLMLLHLDRSKYSYYKRRNKQEWRILMQKIRDADEKQLKEIFGDRLHYIEHEAKYTPLPRKTKS